jgi:hypothetical protein
MEKVLGIFVTSDRHLDKVIKLFQAARKKQIKVILFLSHLGTLLTQRPGFDELKGAQISICKVGFEGHGLGPSIRGIDTVDLTTQARHAELIDVCDRYLVF